MAHEETIERRPRLIVIGPVPPPVHGVAVSTRLTLANPLLRNRFDIEHVDTSDRRPVSTMQRWDVTNVTLGLRNLGQLLRRLRGGRGVVYLPLSGYLGSFLRDSLFIHAASLAGWKVAVHIRNSTFRDFYDACNPLARLWIRVTLDRLASIAVLGPRLRSAFDGLVPPNRIAVVPNGTPDAPRLDVPRNPDRVLFLSNLLAGKGIAEAVDAAFIVVRQRPGTEVLFVGEWEDARLARQLRERARLAANGIRFLPPVSGDQKEALLQSSSVFLFPPKAKEGHPRALLEAICRGIPVVTTKRATLTGTVNDGEGAFVLTDPDPHLLADRVLRLLNDDDLRARMGKAARERYEAAFTQDRADRALADWLVRLAP